MGYSAGAYLLLAEARREQAWLFENSGKQQEAEAAVREAMTTALIRASGTSEAKRTLKIGP
jgi:hypothetical protein